MVQQVPEFVEQGLHVTVQQQGRLAARRWARIEAKHSQIWLRRYGGEQAVHPRPAALVLARIEIDVERTERDLGFVRDAVGAYFRIPHWDSGDGLDVHAVQTLGQREGPFDRELGRKVGSQLFFVEREARLAQLLGIVGYVPRLERRRVLTFQL